MQARLFAPDKIPLVTPRASTSTQSKPVQTQSRLSFSQASSQRPPLADKANRLAPRPSSSSAALRDRKGKARENRRDDARDTEAEDHEPPAKERGWLSSIFRTKNASTSSSSPSSSSSRQSRSNGLGRAILNPSERRRGPTIEFDADLPDSMDLDGEDERRKRRRTEDRGGWGKLDLCDQDMHGGFGTQPNASAQRAERQKRSLELVVAESSKPRSSARKSCSGHTPSACVLALADDDDDELLPPPSTIGSAAYLTARSTRPSQPPPSASLYAPRYSAHPVLCPSTSSPAQGAAGDEDEASPSTASSGSSTERSLQAQLVPFVSSPPPVRPAPQILVPDSDPPSADEADEDERVEDSQDDELDALVERLGQKGGAAIDDSGFAEGGMDLVLAGQPVPADEIDLTSLRTSSPAPAPTLPASSARSLVQAQRDDDDSPNSGDSGSLGRTASAILMPPPAIPRKRLRRGAPSTRAAAAAAAAAAEQSRVLVEETQEQTGELDAAEQARRAALSAWAVQPVRTLCDETQDPLALPVAPVLQKPMPYYKTLPKPPPPPGMRLPTSPAAGAPSSDPDVLPPLPTPRPLVNPLPPSSPPAIAPAAAGGASWTAELSSIWADARPPSPAAPRQTRLGEFFPRVDVLPASQGVVEETQLNGGSGQAAAEMELEQAVALSKALQGFRERIIPRRRELASGAPPLEGDEQATCDVEGDEEILDPDADADELDYVLDSDPEDDAPALVSLAAAADLAIPPSAAAQAHRSAGASSPLGTPVRARFPRYSPRKMRLAIERFSLAHAQTARAEGAVPAAAAAAEAGPSAAVAAADETQWESYWSYPSSSPSQQQQQLDEEVTNVVGPASSGQPLAPQQRALLDKLLRSVSPGDDSDGEEGARGLEDTRATSGMRWTAGECETRADDRVEEWDDTLTGW
ncbi:uncharacterized protein JCM10292_001891 [Rhodotorula paludigena]|uniref:uncharacterized protein n=1 Tax=Rhodotorula paludigena TaxID=86838 RepID=UPI0031734E1A